MPAVARTVILLARANVFMTFARYAHLGQLNDRPWWIAAPCTMGAVYFVFRGET